MKCSVSFVLQKDMYTYLEKCLGGEEHIDDKGSIHSMEFESDIAPQVKDRVRLAFSFAGLVFVFSGAVTHRVFYYNLDGSYGYNLSVDVGYIQCESFFSRNASFYQRTICNSVVYEQIYCGGLGLPKVGDKVRTAKKEKHPVSEKEAMTAYALRCRISDCTVYDRGLDINYSSLDRLSDYLGKKWGIYTFADLCQHTREELKVTFCLGRTRLAILDKLMKYYGLSYGMELTPFGYYWP